MSPSADSTTGHTGGTAHSGRKLEHAVPGPEPVCLVTRFSAVDNTAARELLDELRAIEVSVVAEPGHLVYNVFADQDDPKNLYVIETWTSAADAKRHEDLVIGDGTVERVAPLLTGTAADAVPPARRNRQRDTPAGTRDSPCRTQRQGS
ncbi:putative quinol monooxygenase [Actinacidiphila glaucinigra]|uniref:putative quinol monooxygenase n=1 Tax=Actinacidiphila glaucinigra TaxID=235986 RepID=UPI0036701400